MFDTPILFLIFNRPDTTRQVFEQIRKVQPRQLYIAADGPRPSNADDTTNCQEARDLVMSMIDWNCEVQTLLRDQNLGCARGVSEGITWFFSRVKEGIILEDDCLPDQNFFLFAAELLGHYRDTPNVMHIGGVNFQNGKFRSDGSFYFSKYPHIWGWATWKRAWEKFDFNIVKDPGLQGIINRVNQNELERNYWTDIQSSILSENVNSWAYRWFFSIWKCRGLCIVPNWNLVKNVGFDRSATHTKMNPFQNWKNKITAISTPLNIPVDMRENTLADSFLFSRMHYKKTTAINKIRNFAYRFISQNKIRQIKMLFLK